MAKLLLCTILLKLFSLEVQADANLTTVHCGKSNSLGLKGRVFNGSPTSIDEYPWLVLLAQKIFLLPNTFMALRTCTSSLITSNWVLTAAHCVFDNNVRNYPSYYKQKLSVTLGARNISSILYYRTKNNMPACGPNCITLAVAGTFDHKEYYSREKGIDFKYDIALLRLERNVHYTPYIQPICLPFQPIDRYEGRQVIATGWGSYGKIKNPSEIKRKSIVTIKASADCHEWYTEFVNETYQLCAGGTEGSVCKGDSGGPLVWQYPNDTNTYYQIGVTSLARQECVNMSKPAVYIRVDTFIPWINKTIQNNDQK